MGEVLGASVVTPVGNPAINQIQFARLDERAIMPTRSHSTDAGFDLSYCAPPTNTGITLVPGQRFLVPTGIAVAIPAGAVGLVCPRSGLANKHGITIVNAPGVVDSGYRGELKVILHNTGTEPFVIEHGDRIAQLVVTPYFGEAIEVDSLPDADRGEAGFGSTGT